MVLIKVQYDAYNRQFKLIDRELAHVLEDGETYMLVADVSPEDLKVTGGDEALQSEALPSTVTVHA